MIETIKYPKKLQWQAITQRPVIDSASLEETVSLVLKDIRNNGDTAVRKYTKQFDKIELDNFLVSSDEIKAAQKNVTEELRSAIQLAKSNIEKFHNSQLEKEVIIETTRGVQCWRRSIEIEKVGLYIPGGSAPLFSTILMLAIPAKIAGCKEIVLCTPPDKNGKVNDAILYTAQLTGITKIFKIGGVQAIGAMAFGTESVPRVYKIFGPGNQFVTCAKQLINKSGIAIDMPAGPSELAILADATCVPSFVAADLLSQAEHGSDSQVILVSDNEETIAEVNKELEKQVALLNRKDIATKALTNSKAILVNNLVEGMELLNEYAPEHLILACNSPEEIANLVVNAGSVFIGNYSCESAGDYASGTNHTLPTNGYARSYSGVSVDSFVKKVTFQKLSKEGIQNIGRSIELMAEAEGLDAHKNAVTLRLESF